MKIIIVESPGKIDTIQKYLGNEFAVYASKGHIVELSKGGRFGIGVNPLNNFKTFYNLMPDKIHFLDQIINSNSRIEQIIIASDADIEGEAIAYHIAQNLKHLGKPIVRAEFHEITREGINNGLNNLSEINLNKFKAQETRRILDRIVGFMVSPFLINYYGNTLSAGRVQSVATRMIIEREKEISSFEPKEYWNLSVKIIKDNLSFIAKYNSKLKSQEEANKVKSDLELPSIKDSKFQVLSVSKKPKKENAEAPLTTAKMQQVMAIRYGFDGDRTMQAAQNLYELGFVTYIRTDSTRISDGALKTVRTWLEENKFQIPNAPNTFKNKDATQDAHECIRPTDVYRLYSNMNLSPDAQLLYEMIWVYFVSSQMCQAIFDTIDAKIKHLHTDHLFKFSGKILVYPGYLSILDNKKQSSDKLPEINKNDVFQLSDDNSILLEKKSTQPPSRYNYASLVKELESNGIGRPSTYTAIIGKITDRHYVEKKGNTYYGTKLGQEITDLLFKYFDFMKYDYTANLEKQMDEISAGKINNIEVLNNFYLSFRDKLKEIHIDNGGRKCSKCEAPMYKKTSKNDSVFWGCSLYPFCNYTEILIKNEQHCA